MNKDTCNRCGVPWPINYLPAFQTDPEGWFCGHCAIDLTTQRENFKKVLDIFNLEEDQ